MSDPIIEAAEKHIAADHDRDERLERVRRYAQVLFDCDPYSLHHDIGADLLEIVGAS